MLLSTRRLFIAILFVALCVMATREISDPDFWWHLSTGKYIVETHSIPHVDVFSFTNAGRPWVTHEWLSEVFMYALFLLGSFPALTIVFAGIITLSFAFVYARMDGKPYVAAFALLLGAVATAPTWGARPQMISMLLASVFLFVLEKWRTDLGNHKDRPYVWILVPLMILWVNMHSGYALGLLIIAVYLFGEVVRVIASRMAKQSTNNSTTQLRNHPTTKLALVFLAGLLVVMLNPNGATMYVYPLETLTSPTMQAYIQEWFSPDFHQIEFQPFAWLLLATLAAMGLAGKRTSLTQMLLLAGFAYAGLRSARNIPFFALVAAPVLAEHLWDIVESHDWAHLLSANTRPTRMMAIVNWLLLALIAFAGVIRIGMILSNQSVVERTRFPAAAVDFLQAQKTAGALYNAYDWGGYIMWRMYPQTHVYIDGRADVYGDSFIENVYLKAYRGSTDWREPLDRYNVRAVLIEPDAPLSAQLSRDAAWRKAYEDKLAVVWER